MGTGSGGDTCPLTAEHITPQGDFSFPTIPATPFATLKKEGLPPEMPAERETPFSDSHLVCDMKAGTVTADTIGMVVASDTELRVSPLWTTTEDRMVMTMDFYHQDCFGNPISDDDYRKWLPEGSRGVDNDALDNAVAQAKKTGTPVKGVEIACGRRSADGRDGQIKLKYLKNDGAGTIQQDGSLDYRERGGTRCVAEGDTIAILVPPTHGKPGFDVLGNELPAKDGEPKELKAGTGISTLDGDGGTMVYTASSPGMVVYKDNTLSISDLLEVDTDVDLASGNVHVRKGSIIIKGTVTTGTEVTAEENVVVEDVVENATIKAGGDVTVAGGILMDEGGIIEAKGNVTGKFMRNATIRAEGDVIVEVDIVNCDIVAGGRIIAESDKGIVNGGRYICGGMDVAEAGTDGGASTKITLALPDVDDTDSDSKIDKIKNKIEELEKYIGNGDIKSTLLMAPKEDRGILAELLKIKAKLLARKKKLDEEKAEKLIALGKELAKIKLRVRRTAHAGTTITIGDKSIKLNRAEQASKFHWDPEKGGIAITGL